MSQRQKPIDTLRMNQAQRDALLESLSDKTDNSRDDNDARRHTRVDFRAGDVNVTFLHPGGVETTCVVTPRNLSVSGLGFLHGGFIHENTECFFELPTLFGDTRRVRGKVRSCRLVSGRIHEIGVQFESDIDPYEFLEPNDAPCAGVSHNVDPGDLSGSVLAVESSPADARLLAHHLRDSNVTLEVRSTLEEAEEDIASGAFDVLCFGDSALGANGGADEVQGARSQGFDGPIIAMTAESKGDWLSKLRQCGCSDVIVKPYNPGKLFVTLSQHLSEGGAGVTSGGKIHSSLATDPDAVELLETFLKDVEESIRELHSLISAGSMDQVRAICLGLKGTGLGYGFARFSDAAREVVDSIDDAGGKSKIQTAVKRLELVYHRLTPAPVPTNGDNTQAPPHKPAA